MNSPKAPRRPYNSPRRSAAASATRARILEVARAMFERAGIDQVTVNALARSAGVSPSTIYTQFASKVGVLRALMEDALFGERYQAVIASINLDEGSVARLVATARIARAIHEGESAALGLLRGASSFSPALRRLERIFEDRRYEMQRERVELVWDEGLGKQRLTLEEARRLLWTYTSRDVYRMLVEEAGWTPARYEEWLAETLLVSLVEPAH